MLKDWVRHCTELATSDKGEFEGSSIKVFKKKILTFSPGEVELKDFGYSITNPQKFNQLMNYYYNAESVERAKKFLERKGNVSVGILLQGKEKTFTSQDYCMQNMIIERNKGIYDITVCHRNTELIKKFGADLVFVNNIVKQLGLENATIDFYLNRISINAMFYPLLIPYQDDWEYDLLKIRKKDFRFYKNIIRWSYRYLHGEVQQYRFVRRVQQSLPRMYDDKLLIKFSNFIKGEYNG